MKTIQVLGLGNNRHRQLTHLLEQELERMGLAIPVEQVMDIEVILASGVDAIPAVLVGGQVVYDGRTLPTRADVQGWLTAILQPGHAA